MKAIDLLLLILMVALAKAQFEEWYVNRDSDIVIAQLQQDPPNIKLWQCGTLKQLIADLQQPSMPVAFQHRGENIEELKLYIRQEWLESGCSQLDNEPTAYQKP